MALGTGGCTKDTPGFCCSSLESCAGTGASSVVACELGGSRPFCDDTGAHGPAHTCIPDPSAPGCQSSLECTQPARPVCDIDDTGTCIGCETANDCTRFADERLCDPVSHACVECVENTDCTSTALPICGDDGVCRGCSADAQCPTGVCDEDAGACVLESDLIYVNKTSGAGTACTMASPCATIASGIAAITPSRRYMKISAEEYMESMALDGKDLTIIGPGAGLQPPNVNTAALLVLNDSTVRIEGLRLHDAGGGPNADGIRCAAPVGGTPSVTMVGTRIEGNGGFGIDANACAITLVDGEVVGNPGGGISITAGSFDITNSFITGNGAATSVGGVKLDSNDATGRFEFNTVAGNLAGLNVAAGIVCMSVQNQRIANNIFWGAGPDQVASTNCNLEFNLSNEGLSGQGNVTATPLFLSSTNYHLMPTSEGIDDADPNATLPIDFDGDPRPQGTRRDIGADEIP
jgi:hypothetical protein